MGPAIAKKKREVLTGCAPKRLAYPFVAIGAVGTLLSCGGEDTTTTPPAVEPSRPAQISIDPDEFAVTAGETVRLKGVVLDQRGKHMFNAELTWATSDPAIATVDTAGIVTGSGRARPPSASPQPRSAPPPPGRSVVKTGTISSIS